jgi:hypothetical protein
MILNILQRAECKNLSYLCAFPHKDYKYIFETIKMAS